MSLLLLLSSPTGAPSPVDTYTFQWQSSPHGANTWTNIGGATSAAYVSVTADIGNDLSCNVTATNDGGSATQRSNILGPVFTPVIITFAYQWQASPAGAAIWSDIAGVTTSAYVQTTDVIGRDLSCVVTATTDGGSTSQRSNVLTAPPLPPVVEVDPVPAQAFTSPVLRRRTLVDTGR